MTLRTAPLIVSDLQRMLKGLPEHAKVLALHKGYYGVQITLEENGEAWLYDIETIIDEPNEV